MEEVKTQLASLIALLYLTYFMQVNANPRGCRVKKSPDPRICSKHSLTPAKHFAFEA